MADPNNDFCGSDAPDLVTKREKFIRKLTVLISGGMFIDGFILGGVGIVMPAITNDLHLSSTWQGLIGASALIGIFFGGPLGGYLADRFGRKPMFTIDLAVFLIGSVAQFFVSQAPQLMAIRLVMGVAIGADYAIGWPLLAEFSSARIRGKLLVLQETAWYVGFLIAYAIGWVLTISESAHWNFILGLSTVPTAIVILLRLGTPESPRWLMSKGRADEAMAIAADFMDEAERHDLGEPQGVRGHSFSRLFSRNYLKSTLFVSIFFVCNVTPYFAIGTFAPVVLQDLGLKDGLTGGLALNALAMLGTLVTAFSVERIGRRKLAIAPFYLSAMALLLVAVLPNAPPAIIVTSVLVFSFVNAVSTSLTALFPSEVFPTEIRGSGTGFATAISRIGAAIGTFLLPISIQTLGISTTMLIAAGISLTGGVVTHLLAPETTGKLLSETVGSTAA
ncbi:MAG TPA: MFS transporter [Sphingomicrobium sp.]|nr:MFS transporter [Sphingomicrobium sp.]